MGKINLNGAKNVHFIGIGGISMSGLAEVLKKDGYAVSGSDDVAGQTTEHLKSLGIKVAVPNSAENISDDTDLVVYTAAVKPENPEYRAAQQKNKPLMERAELIGEILKGYEHAICIAGTHGKTTTTSLVAEVTLAAGLDPTISIGGHMGFDGSNYRVGNSSCFVLEACEYRHQFHYWHPHAAIILNIDADHLDFYGNIDGVINSFKIFAENIRPGGLLVIQTGKPGFEEVTKNLTCDVVTFGIDNASRFWPGNVEYDNLGRPSFDVMDGDKLLARVNLPLQGQYNMLNALACFAAMSWMDIDSATIANALCAAKGVKRRFEHKGTFNGADIIDDYAHHPTEIKATLSAAENGCHNRIICAFQPHTYTRTRSLLDEFSTAFEMADIVLILPVYAAREVSTDPHPNYLVELLADKIVENGVDARFVESFKAASEWIKENCQGNDLLITMGAGDIHILGEGLISGDL